MMNENKTLEYYNKNADNFAKTTINVDFYETQNRFSTLLPEHRYILDFGCGSEEMCYIASNYTGIQVRRMLFEELDENKKYDGIWACSSILHLPKNELKAVFMKMFKALKEDGIIYTSFKYGDFEGERNGRYFTDFTEKTFEEFVEEIDNLQLKEEWITGDVRPGRGEEKWLNVILQKN